MADRFDMDFGASSVSSVRKVAEEAARFEGIAPAGSAHGPRPARVAAPGRERRSLYLEGAPLADSLAAIVESGDASSLSLAGCERLDTHVSSEVKRRMKVFCAVHGLNLRVVCELAFEALVAAMDDYEDRGMTRC